ncbi:MAG: class I SAM-dependent methyltransferase [Pseudomonadota bacterium]
MSNRTFTLQEPLYQYLLSVSLREPDVLRELREETRQLAHAGMQIAPEQGQFMALLAELIGARKCLEIGTFTGYSALAVALSLPRDGKLIACDVSEEWTSIARRYWALAGVAEQIELRLAPASETLSALLQEGHDGTFDYIFIDADKVNYFHYYDLSLKLLRTGGLIVVDNVLWDGKVAVPQCNDSDTAALKEFNQKLHGDERVSLSMIPIGDGLSLVRKR